MKQLIYKIPFYVLPLLMLASYGLHAQKFVTGKTIHKSYNIGTSVNVDITNKYGKIHIVPWTQDKVDIQVDIMVSAADSATHANTVAKVNIDFTASDYHVTAKTNFETKSSFLSDLRKLTSELVSEESSIRIDYTVKVPAYANLTLDNKYGDVFVDDCKGDLKLLLSNGNFKANNLSGAVDLQIKFGKAYINSLLAGRLNLSYMDDMTIKDAESLQIYSKSSKISIDDVRTLKIDSRRDQFYINSVSNIYGAGYFSDFIVKKFLRETNLDMKYGQVSFDKINSDFQFINIVSQYTTVNLFFPANAGFQFELQKENINLMLPINKAQLTEKQDESNKEVIHVKGHIGNSQQNQLVKITAKDAGVNIYLK